MDLFDRLGCMLLVCESYERESSRSPSLAVFWDVDIDDFTDFSEELTKLLVRGAVVEVPNENFT